MEADMNILIVSGSPRKGGNTDIMAETFREEVVKKGHQAEPVSYTHLDVYKRQLLYCFQRGNNQKGGIRL